MDKCNDYWCENYGANNAKCAECKQQDNEKDAPDMRVILRRRTIEQTEALESAPKKTMNQDRTI